MKPQGPTLPTIPPGSQREERKIPIPPGTILYDPDVSHRGETLDEQRKLEGMQSFGVISIKERFTNIDEGNNYRPRKDWNSIPKEGVPATIIFVGGMAQKVKIVVEKQNLKAEEINQIIKLCFNIDQVHQQYILSRDVLEKTDETVNALRSSLETYSTAKAASPALFEEEASPSALLDESIEEDVKKQIGELGVLVEKIEGALVSRADKINLIIKKLDDLKVLAIQNAGMGLGMWWPVKKFIEKPFPAK